jgi:uncharacterized membrane protein YkoI
MKPRLRACGLSLAALSLGLALGLAPAAGVAAQDKPEAHAGSQVPLSTVLREIAKRHPGRQLNTTMGESGVRPVYNVQWQLTNGQVVVFVIDARTGQEIG